MKVVYKTSFIRDSKKTPADTHAALLNVIEAIENAPSLKEISNLKKLKGHKTAYRIKLNTYRICFHFDGDILTFERFLPRKEVYRFFP